MVKITDEMLYAFITKNVSIDESENIQNAIESDEETKAKYQEILNIRETHEEFIRDFEKKPMPKRIEELFTQTNSIKQNNFFSRFARGPLAGFGWIGFIITGLFVFPTMTIQMAQNNKTSNTMIASTDDQEIRFRGLDGEIMKEISIGELFKLKTGSNEEFEITISSVLNTTEQTCFTITINYDNKTANNLSKLCIDK